MLKKLNILCHSYQVKKQYYNTNGERVLTVIALLLETEFGARFLVIGACQNTPANFYLLSICNRRSFRFLFWRLGKHQMIIRP